MNDYTEIERELIIKSMEITRSSFEKDLDPGNDEDIVKAVLLYKSQYHMSAENQKIAAEIFRKNGLWKNGKITLIEHDQQILNEKVEQAIRYKELRQKKVDRLKELKAVIDNNIQKIEDKPKEIALQIDEKRKEIQDNAYAQLDRLSKELTDELNQISEKYTNLYEQRKEVILNDLKIKIEDLKKEERLKIDVILNEYDELVELQREYGQIERNYTSEINIVQNKIEESDSKLFDLTIRELREIATEKGIEVPARILKADIVNMIEESE